MKAITVRQPWAWAIAYGGKTVENRCRPDPWRSATGHRIAIHAGKGYDEDDLADVGLLATGYSWEDKEYLDVRGAVIATARLVDVHPCEPVGRLLCNDWAQPGQWHLVLDDVTPLTRPISCRGYQGLWTLPEGLITAAATDLAASAPDQAADAASTTLQQHPPAGGEL